MGRTRFDVVQPAAAFERLPIHIVQKPSRGRLIARLLLILPAVAAVAVPLLAMVFHAVRDPDWLALVAARPLAAAQITAGLALCVGLFVLPASRAVMQIGARREVEIADGQVHIADSTLLGRRTRTVPLSGYVGVAHHIRASLSGLTHEILLVHRDPVMTITLTTADAISQSTLDRTKALLNLPEVSPGVLYGRDRAEGVAATAALAPAGA